MERTMSVEDKIRRAEEIYNRRRENEYKGVQIKRIDNKSDVTNKHINKKLKKMIIQIIICMVIYLVFNYIINSNNVFSEDFRKKCREILAYDISFSETYKKIVNGVTVLKEKYEETLLQNNEENNNLTTEDNNIESQESIGGATESVAENNEWDLEAAETTESLTEEEQMKKDAEEIKTKISFIKPLEGTVTSVFGWRNPTVSTVSKYHTGIDISANQGTDIISATNGKVVLASSEGAYGNHLKIQIEDVIIIYAHCLSLEVREEDKISQGQVIAKVGSTGNSTGPHLHFEIRKEDRYVNPDLILDF